MPHGQESYQRHLENQCARPCRGRNNRDNVQVLQVDSCGDAQLRVLLPPGGQGAVRASHDTDPEGLGPHGCPDRLDQLCPQLDARRHGVHRRTCRRPFLAQVDNNLFAYGVVAHDVHDGLCRRLEHLRVRRACVLRRDVLPVGSDGGRRELLRPMRFSEHGATCSWCSAAPAFCLGFSLCSH